MVESFKEFPDYVGLRHDTEVMGNLDMKNNGKSMSNLSRKGDIQLQSYKVQQVWHEAREESDAYIALPLQHEEEQ